MEMLGAATWMPTTAEMTLMAGVSTPSPRIMLVASSATLSSRVRATFLLRRLSPTCAHMPPGSFTSLLTAAYACRRIRHSSEGCHPPQSAVACMHAPPPMSSLCLHDACQALGDRYTMRGVLHARAARTRSPSVFLGLAVAAPVVESSTFWLLV